MKYHVGSILNVSGFAYDRSHWYDVISAIQKEAGKDRLKIPVIYGIDAIHGVTYTLGSTLFPQEIAMAATFNREHCTSRRWRNNRLRNTGKLYPMELFTGFGFWVNHRSGRVSMKHLAKILTWIKLWVYLSSPATRVIDVGDKYHVAAA